MYNIGTVTTTANSNKLTGTGTKWKENISLISPQQVIQIMIGTTVYSNSIHSIQSNTELTLNFPIPVAAKDAKYVILTTMIDSIADAGNKIVTMNIANVQFSDILNRWMTEQGIIAVTLPDGTTQQLRTTKEIDKQLDGKVDKTVGEMESITVYKEGLNYPTLRLKKEDGSSLYLESKPNEQLIMSQLYERGSDGKVKYSVSFPKATGTAMLVGDYGWGGVRESEIIDDTGVEAKIKSQTTQIWRGGSQVTKYSYRYAVNLLAKAADTFFNICVSHDSGNVHVTSGLSQGVPASQFKINTLYGTANTTKDSNGNLKAASPIIKVFADSIELNEESEGVEMEHLGVGHYLIKGVLGFNADGAWGINNGFVIPQDHNGKNMVLIDYDVKPDGDIELFVFHQQNADMPERFQNKRIKHVDEEGEPVYFEDYEPCDVPESRWIDMRVEMPPNSIYNLKQAEAAKLANYQQQFETLELNQ